MTPDVPNAELSVRDKWCGRCLCDWFGLAGLGVTWGLLAYACALSLVVLVEAEPLASLAASCLVLALGAAALASHLAAVYSDPGRVTTRRPPAEGETFCWRCLNVKPLRAHHCSVCRRCVLKMDHHCPWINNCVGRDNQKAFVLFNVYVAWMASAALVMAVLEAVRCWGGDCSYLPKPLWVLLFGLLVLISLGFLLFCLVMVVEQLRAVWADETGVERLKQEEVRWPRVTRWDGLRATFGSSPVTWLCPFNCH